MQCPSLMADPVRSVAHGEDDRTEHEGRSESELAILASSILIVDDQAAHVQLLTRLLQDAGYTHVSSTTDPRQVCALHRHHRFDLILLDLQTQGLDGFGVTQGLMLDLASTCPPIIVLTAQPDHKLRALQAGARDFINKPFEAVEVQVRVHHTLEVRLLHKALLSHHRDLERVVQERTAALRASEARYRSLTELAVDWYWEQNEDGQLTRASGMVMELLGVTDVAQAAHEAPTTLDAALALDRWDPQERQVLADNIKGRRPFLDLLMHRRRADGSQQQFRISGEPMFDGACRFTGYRGLGVEVRS